MLCMFQQTQKDTGYHGWWSYPRCLVDALKPKKLRCPQDMVEKTTGGQTGSSVQGQMLRLPGFLHW